MSTIVYNEEDLNTLSEEDLVTEDYALEILGLKNVTDFRKFSRSFMKLSKIVKENENRISTDVEEQIGEKLKNYYSKKEIDSKTQSLENTKLEKGEYDGTAKNLKKEIDMNEAILIANSGIPYDKKLVYLNDIGTKKAGYFYLDRLKNGLFECLKDTTTTLNDTQYFRDFSNKSNSNNLNNLIKIESKNNYTNITDFDNVSATLYYVGTICFCIIRLNYTKGSLPATRIPFPVKFKTSPFVTITDSDIGFNPSKPVFSWSGTDAVELKGAYGGFEILLIGNV